MFSEFFVLQSKSKFQVKTQESKGKKALLKVNIQVRDRNQDQNSGFSNPTSLLVTSFHSDLISTYYIEGQQ